MVHTQEGSVLSAPNLKQIALFVQKLLRGSQNLEMRSCDPWPRPFRGRFIIRTQEGLSSMSVPN